MSSQNVSMFMCYFYIFDYGEKQLFFLNKHQSLIYNWFKYCIEGYFHGLFLPVHWYGLPENTVKYMDLNLASFYFHHWSNLVNIVKISRYTVEAMAALLFMGINDGVIKTTMVRDTIAFNGNIWLCFDFLLVVWLWNKKAQENWYPMNSCFSTEIHW